jgi:hypothetical protein
VDLALAVALGGDCLTDIALLRAEPGVFGPVASDPTVSRLIDTLASADEKALTEIRNALSEVRQHAWTLAGSGRRTPVAGDRGPGRSPGRLPLATELEWVMSGAGSLVAPRAAPPVAGSARWAYDRERSGSAGVAARA